MQQQALRDFAQAMTAFFNPGNPAGRPSWRKAGRDEGFRIVGRGQQWDVRRLSRKTGEVWVPKAGWCGSAGPAPSRAGASPTRSRWTARVAGTSPSPRSPIRSRHRVTARRWGSTGGDGLRGLVHRRLRHAPALTARERTRLRRLQRTLARAKRGSNRRSRVRHAIARLKARESDRRKDWAEKVSTDIARRFDVIRVEDLKITNMTRSARGTQDDPGRNVRQKAGLNRGILGSGWGLLVRRLEDKAPGRVEKVKPHYTSQRCSACGQVDRDSRESQAVFRCTACGFAGNADVNAAINIAAGHAVTARGGDGAARPVNREPHLLLPSA